MPRLESAQGLRCGPGAGGGEAVAQKLVRARARLTAEVDAVYRLGTQKDHRTTTTPEKEHRP